MARVGSRHGREGTNGSNQSAAALRADVAGTGDHAPFASRPETPTIASAPHAAATRRTLIFPSSDVLRAVEPGAVERKARSRALFGSKEPEAKTLLRALGGYESSSEVVDDRSDSDARDVASARPSELSTVPTLASKGIARDSSASIIELSASELASERELSSASRALRAPPVPKRLSLVGGEESDGARAITDAPPRLEAPDVPRPSRRSTAVGLLVSHGMVAALVAIVTGADGPAQQGIRAPIVREPNVALSERTPLASPVASAPVPPPSGGCAASGDPRVLASRAQIGPGLDVSVLETGFGLALAAGTREAVGLRIEGSGLRVAETVRVKAPSVVSHAVVEAGREDESDSLDVRVDADEARTVVGGAEAPAFRIVARGDSIMALLDDLRGVRVRNIWSLPGARTAAAPARAAASSKPSPYRPPGFSRIGDPPRAPVAPAPAQVAEVVRAVARDDGGAVIALRRPSTLWLGVTDASLAPAGPLVSLARKGATVGSPAVAPWGGGGAVAWAERSAGEREWTIVVAGFAPGEGATTIGPVRVIGKGMSPTLAALPDGDLLLAHADGPSGAHRVVARRLGRDLEPRGEPLVVSPDAINAGQPVAAVRPDGRAIVAFFAADRGAPRAGTVLATPLACDPGF